MARQRHEPNPNGTLIKHKICQTSLSAWTKCTEEEHGMINSWSNFSPEIKKKNCSNCLDVKFDTPFLFVFFKFYPYKRGSEGPLRWCYLPIAASISGFMTANLRGPTLCRSRSRVHTFRCFSQTFSFFLRKVLAKLKMAHKIVTHRVICLFFDLCIYV